MTQAKLEERVVEIDQRVAELEAEVLRLSKQMNGHSTDEIPWWKKIVGIYKDDPDFEEAMRLGRAYRERQRPKEDDNAA
jgi:hypothetical protein